MLRIFEMFAGYGGASFALKKAGIPFVCVGYSEIKKAAIKCYQANHKDIHNYGDCTRINTDNLPDFDLLCGGFPCQTFSIAGKRKGFEDSRGTLFREIIRIASEKKPEYMLLENVEGLIYHDNGNSLRVIVRKIEKIGYSVIYKVLDSSDYGIPQTRRRIFFICRYGKPWQFNEFRWPSPKPYMKLIDLLENEVPEKYFLTDTQMQKILNWKSQINPLKHVNTCESTVSTLTASCASGMQLIENKAKFIDEMHGIGLCHAWRIRKLTPRECFRLMGFVNDEIDISMLSDNTAYNLAGDGWEINVVSLLMKEIHRIWDVSAFKSTTTYDGLSGAKI